MAISIQRVQPDADRGELPIAPLIDVVFLLLIYFMISSTIQKQEADIGFSLPATVESAEAIDFLDRQVIEIDAQGRPWVNGYAYDEASERRFVALASMLNRFREGAEASKSDVSVTLAPDPLTPHQMIVKVMDACESAGLKAVRFRFED